jgi:hypothetical protein
MEVIGWIALGVVVGLPAGAFLSGWLIGRSQAYDLHDTFGCVDPKPPRRHRRRDVA